MYILAVCGKSLSVEGQYCLIDREWLGGVAPFVLPYIDAKLRAYQTERQAGPTEGAILMLRKQLESTS